MNIDNLAIIFTPCLFKSPKDFSNIKKNITIFTFMINNFEELFPKKLE
jgi:hypothetical protein